MQSIGSYQYPKAMRATRDLLRRRTRLVRYSAELKAHVKNTASQYNVPDIGSHNLRYAQAREKARNIIPDASAQISVDLDLNLIEHQQFPLY